MLCVVILFSEDAKLGKKCTLLDLSRRPNVAEQEAQGAAVLNSEAKHPIPSSLSKPATDHLDSVEDLESNEGIKEDLEEGVDDKEKSEESSVGEALAKMEVDPTDSRSDEEQSMTECDLVCDNIVFNRMLSMRCTSF